MAKQRHQRGAPAAYASRANTKPSWRDRTIQPLPSGTDESEWVPLKRMPDEVGKSPTEVARRFENNLYVVLVTAIDVGGRARDCYRDMHLNGWLHIHIGRRDDAPICPWQHKQRIKNQVVGANSEAVEIFPAHNNLVDVGNVFHLWASANPAHRVKFGFGLARSVDPARDFPPDEYIGGEWPPDSWS